MNILYCGDKNIAAGVAISAYSLALRTREPLDIYILTAAPKVKGRDARSPAAQLLRPAFEPLAGNIPGDAGPSF